MSVRPQKVFSISVTFSM